VWSIFLRVHVLEFRNSISYYHFQTPYINFTSLDLVEKENSGVKRSMESINDRTEPNQFLAAEASSFVARNLSLV